MTGGETEAGCASGRGKEGKRMKIALVTGASSGLGQAFVQRLERDPEVEGYWLVARRRERMEQLAASLSKPAEIFSLDLLRREDLDCLSERLAQEKPRVSLLINCAGFGKFGTCYDLTQEENDGMIDLNCRAAVAVTTACLPYLYRGSRVIQVASSAAFQPLPGFGVYAASKAFLLRYTRSLRWELAPKGIRVTALCPGWVNTEFIQVARDTRNSRAVNHIPLRANPQRVVAAALAGNRVGLAVVTASPFTLMQRIGAKLLPSCVIMAVWEAARRV